MTQIESAKRNELTPEMQAILKKEEISSEELMNKVAEGKIVILKNINHENVIPTAVGEGLLIKTNANLGTSNQRSCLE